MKVECMFEPCPDCETKNHCPKYWKAKAFDMAKLYAHSLNERERIETELTELKADYNVVVQILKGFKIQMKG